MGLCTLPHWEPGDVAPSINPPNDIYLLLLKSSKSMSLLGTISSLLRCSLQANAMDDDAHAPPSHFGALTNFDHYAPQFVTQWRPQAATRDRCFRGMIDIGLGLAISRSARSWLRLSAAFGPVCL